MLKVLAWSLGIGVVGGALVTGLKATGLLALPADFLYRFYEHSPVFASSRGQDEFLVLQVVLIFVLTAATAWAMLKIPAIARRVCILLGAIVLLAFLSPVLALYGTKVEPFSWILAVICGALPCIFLINLSPAKKRLAASPLQGRRTAGLESNATGKPTTAINETDQSEISIVVCSLYTPDDPNSNYLEQSKAILDSVREFLASSGAALDEPAPDFVRAWFGTTDTNGGHAHDACESALLLERQLSKTQASNSIGFGIAVDSGVCDMSIRKEKRRKILHVSGPTVDTTRERSLSNRVYGSKIIIGARALRLAEKMVEVRPLELVKSRERSSLEEIYELIGLAGSLSESDRLRRDAYWEGIVSLRSNNYEDALARFNVAADSDSGRNDPVLDYFMQFAEHGRTSTPS